MENKVIQLNLSEREAELLYGFYMVGMGQANMFFSTQAGTISGQVLKDSSTLVRHGIAHLRNGDFDSVLDTLSDKMGLLHDCSWSKEN
jgi:hypothetical protein